MKHLVLISFIALLVAIYPGSGVAYAQHGHGAGLHGAAGSHGHDGHAGSNAPSKNPGEVLDHNSHLVTKLEGLLGLSGPKALQTLKQDASTFKNFGQFVAAVHVSHNLGIPFAQLQAKMTGKNAVSLGKAIQELKPGANAKAEAKKATKEADDDLKESSK